MSEWVMGVPKIDLIGRFPWSRYSVSVYGTDEQGFYINVAFFHTKVGARLAARKLR